MIGRRAFIAIVGSGILSASLARAQKPSRYPRIGILSESRTSDGPEDLLRGLAQSGYVDGRTALIEWATSDASKELPELASALVQRKVDIIITLGSEATQAAKQATPAIPIVFAAGDPVGAGFVQSLARPGGNLTGITLQLSDLAVKYLQLIKDVLPDASDVAVLWSSANASMAQFLRDVEGAAPQFRVRIHPVVANDDEGVNSALAAIERMRPRAMIVLHSDLIFEHDRRISEFALRNRIATLGSAERLAEEGMLMSYGSLLGENTRQMVDYVDKILKGARPAALPVQQPTKFKLLINLKTARALKLTIPQSLLLRADEVIQ